jgi:hypothetical protein
MVSCQEKFTINTSVATPTSAFCTTPNTVSVTTSSTPSMSLDIRDITSPERLLVKNDTGCAMRFSNSSLRSRKTMSWLISAVT